jgi:hypothetical protein
MYKSYDSPGFRKQIVPILLILHYNSSLVTWTAYIFFVCFTLSYAANVMIRPDHCLLPVHFCYVTVYIWKMTATHKSDLKVMWQTVSLPLSLCARHPARVHDQIFITVR